MTVLEIIQLSAEFLARKGVDAPRLQTELLLAHLLKLPRMQLYLNFERALAPEELEGFRQLIRRRGRREPLQLIIGSTSFRHNAALHGVTDRIQFCQGDGFAALPMGAALDLVISNPPYIPSAEIETLEPEVRHYDPRRALDGGPDGLDYYRRIAAETGPFLRPNGKIMLEFGDGQAERICEIFQRQMWIVEAVEQDYTQRPRMLIARRSNSATDGHS